MKEYVPIFFDWLEVTGELNAQEKGRLIDAIVLYAQGGDWQEQIKGNERYLFPAFRKQIDRGNELSGIRSRASNGNKLNQTQTNDNKPEQTESNTIKTPNKNNKKKKEDEDEKEKETNTRTREGANELLTRFDRFWNAYPRHTDRKTAFRAFGKVNPDDAQLSAMLTAIERQKHSDQWTRDGGAYIPHPSTWLNQERWNDELVAAQPAKTVIAQQYDQRDYSQEQPRKVPDWMLEDFAEMQKEGAG